MQKRNKHFSRDKSRKPQSAKAASSREPLVPKDWRWVVGFHAIREVLKVRPRSLKQAWIRQGFESSQELKEIYQELQSHKVKVEMQSPGFLDKVVPHNQGLIVFSAEVPELDWDLLQKKQKATVLLLDGIEDPHNLGAILRTAWLMGVDGVLIPADRSVGLTPATHKVACGGVEHVPVEICQNFSNPIEKLKEIGFWVFGLAAETKQNLFNLKVPEKVVWAIGAEDKGLRVTTERLCDELIAIPQTTAAASYNASVAVAITLTESFRQKNHHKS